MMILKRSRKYGSLILIVVLALLSTLLVESAFAQTPYYYPVSGTLAPGQGHVYGPYGGGIITIQVALSWTPSNTYLYVGISTNIYGPFQGYVQYGSPKTWSFGGLDRYQSYYILIWNPIDVTVGYSGNIICWRT